MHTRDEFASRNRPKTYLVGGGIASLAAAAFLIRDGDFPGSDIVIFEQLDRLGGSLDGAGSAENGYVLRGGRMVESKYLCTWDLFSSIPSLDETSTVTQEIFKWNEVLTTSAKSRLVRHGRPIDGPEFGLTEKQIVTLERMVALPEGLLGNSRIVDEFDPSFFATNFWLMWSTTFAFQPWHSAVEFRRYLLRFMHMIAGFGHLHGIMRTRYNQYDSLVRPLMKWLNAHGVQFQLNTQVTDLAFREEVERKSVERIMYRQGGVETSLEVGRDDYVIVTLGSMTEASSLGSAHAAPVLNKKPEFGSWALWEKIAAGRPEFGRPTVFDDHISQSKWMSFTTTQHDENFFRLVRDFTGNIPGEGGLITFVDSSWLMSIVLPHQPHFIDQPANVNVFWGYALSVDKPGDFVRKPMSQCTGREVMKEVLGHLHIEAEAAQILDASTCIPCMMPFITSQFLRREPGDRPEVIPERTANLAFVGQFCEVPDDVVFTCEYSIRSAQMAVYALLGLKRKPPAVYKGQHSFEVLYRAFETLHGITT